MDLTRRLPLDSVYGLAHFTLRPAIEIAAGEEPSVQTRSVPGAVFYAVVRNCLSQQRQPTEAEARMVAAKIWNESFEGSTGLRWSEVPERTHRRIFSAAFGALGFPEMEIDQRQE